MANLTDFKVIWVIFVIFGTILNISLLRLSVGFGSMDQVLSRFIIISRYIQAGGVGDQMFIIPQKTVFILVSTERYNINIVTFAIHQTTTVSEKHIIDCSSFPCIYNTDKCSRIALAFMCRIIHQK